MFIVAGQCVVIPKTNEFPRISQATLDKNS